MKIALVIVIWSALGAAACGSSPEEVIKEYIAALREKNSSKIAELTAPADLSRFRSFFSYFDHRANSEFGEQLRKMYFGSDATKESVKALSDAQFYAAYLTASRQIILSFGSSSLEMADYKILGHVAQDAVDHYIVSFYADVPLPGADKPFAFSQPVVISLTQDKEGAASFLQIPDQVFMNAVAIFARINGH